MKIVYNTKWEENYKIIDENHLKEGMVYKKIKLKIYNILI